MQLLINLWIGSFLQQPKLQQIWLGVLVAPTQQATYCCPQSLLLLLLPFVPHGMQCLREATTARLCCPRSRRWQACCCCQRCCLSLQPMRQLLESLVLACGDAKGCVVAEPLLLEALSVSSA